VEVVNQ